MDGTSADGWETELERWLWPFLARLRRKEQRRWAPFYLKGLILPGERKSVEPMAARVAPADTQQLHHFVSTSPWATAPLEDELVKAADRLAGGPDAVLVVDDTALVEQGRRSVGVKRQYCGQLGKRANCQSLVSLTLARGEVPVCVGLRLFLPEDWCGDAGRRVAAGVPEAVGYRPKWRIALDEIDRTLAAGARFGCVLADAEYGKGSRVPPRPERTEPALGRRHPADAEGLPGRRGARVPCAQADRPPAPAPRALGRQPGCSRAARGAAGAVSFHLLADWHHDRQRRSSVPTGAQALAPARGPLQARFAALRVRVADGPVVARAQHLPGEEAWLVGEHRTTGERKYYLTN